MLDQEAERDQSVTIHRVRVQTLLESRLWPVIVSELMLSPREVEIVERIIAVDAAEVPLAQHLGISPHTVHTHIERMYRKLNVTSRTQLLTCIFLTYAAVSGKARVPTAR
jgi:DNA-binding CsgD family transcriptional regulator